MWLILALFNNSFLDPTYQSLYAVAKISYCRKEKTVSNDKKMTSNVESFIKNGLGKSAPRVL